MTDRAGDSGESHAAREGELAAYLLDALSSKEADAFERHLRGCERCRSQARWLKGALDVLPTTVEQLQPPPQLRERLMTAVQEDVPRPDAKRKRREPRPRRRGLARGFLLRPATGFALVAIVAAVIGGYLIGGGPDSTKTTTVEAAATPVEPGARASVVMYGDRGMGMVKVERLPVQRRGHVYETWLRHGDRVAPASLFVVRPDGSGEAAIPSGLDDASEVMVTLEPARGSAVPTTRPILRAEI